MLRETLLTYTQIYWVKINYVIAIRPNFSLATAICRNDKGKVMFGHSSFSPETLSSKISLMFNMKVIRWQ